MRYQVGIHCPQHGFQYGRTRCKVCSFDPLDTSSSAVKGASLQPTGNGVAAFSADVLNDQFQEIFDGTP